MENGAARKGSIIWLGAFLILGFLFPIMVPVPGYEKIEWKGSFVNIEALGHVPGAVAFLLVYPLIAGIAVLLLATTATEKVRSASLVALGVIPFLVLLLGVDLKDALEAARARSLRGGSFVGTGLSVVTGYLVWTCVFLGTRTRWHRPEGKIPYVAGVAGAGLFAVLLLIPLDFSDFSSVPLAAPFLMISGYAGPEAMHVPGLRALMIFCGVMSLAYLVCFATACAMCLLNQPGDAAVAKRRARYGFRWFLGAHAVLAVWVLLLLSFLPSGPHDMAAGLITLILVKGLLFVGSLALLLPMGLSDLIVTHTPPSAIAPVPRYVNPDARPYAADDDPLFARRGESANPASSVAVAPEIAPVPEPPPEAPPAESAEMESWNAEMRVATRSASAAPVAAAHAPARKLPLKWLLYGGAAGAVLVVVILACWKPAPARSDSRTAVIKSSAELAAKALLAEEYGTFADHAWPALVSNLGGKDRMIETLKAETSRMQMEGYSFSSVVIGEPQAVEESRGVRYSLVPQKVIIKVPRGRVIQDGYLLALSKDGERWYFLDTVRLNAGNIGAIVPELDGVLLLPPRKNPVFETDAR